MRRFDYAIFEGNLYNNSSLYELKCNYVNIQLQASFNDRELLQVSPSNIFLARLQIRHLIILPLPLAISKPHKLVKQRREKVTFCVKLQQSIIFLKAILSALSCILTIATSPFFSAVQQSGCIHVRQRSKKRYNELPIELRASTIVFICVQ